MNKKILAASVAAVMMGSTGLATAALEVGADRGQLLLSPLFVADAGHSSDIVIRNTSNVHAVKAKMVFRSHCDSAEVLDFILYLTPGDVWRGSVVWDGTTARLVTSDDSSRVEADVGEPSEWNNVVPANFPLYTDKINVDGTSNCGTANGDSNDFGHFEVFGVYAVNGDPEAYDADAAWTGGAGTSNLYTIAGETGTIEVARGMSKTDLARILDAGTTAGNTVTTWANAGVHGVDRTDNVIQTDGTSGAYGVMSYAPAMLQISGTVDVVSVTGERSSFNIPALGAPTDAPYDFTPANSVNYVVSSETFDAFIGADTPIGVNMGDNVAVAPYVNAGDNIGLIENALARAAQSWQYQNGDSNVDATGVLVSAPTRYRHIETDLVTVCDSVTNPGDDEYGAPFGLATGSIKYNAVFYDNSENTPTSPPGGATSGGVEITIDSALPEETNYWVPEYPAEEGYESGQAIMTLVQQNVAAGGCAAYSGMPLLGMTLRFSVADGGAVNYMFNDVVSHSRPATP